MQSRRQKLCLMLMAALMTVRPQGSLAQTLAPNNAASQSPIGNNEKNDSDSCHAHRVTSLPGSHAFGSEFIVAMASDPDPEAKDSSTVWALTADLSDTIPASDRAMYISKSVDGGETWIQVVRLDSRYFDAKIGEGLRNGLSVSPGAADLVITTQRGAFQVIPQSGDSDAVVKSIPGLRVPHPRPRLSRPKKAGDPLMAGVVQITSDGKEMVVGYGYFDLKPQLITYHKAGDGSWIEDRPLPHLPTEMDILSMQFDNARSLKTGSLYLGTGDQAYRLNLPMMRWSRIVGVGDDSAIHGMSIVGGLHLAACWGVYNPVSADAVKRVTDARFLLHRFSDEVGPDIRAYGIEVDPIKPNRQILTSITGAYTSDDGGKSWKRLNDLPDGEYRSSHFNSDGSAIVSGLPGTFLVNPFSDACSPRLRTRDQ
jgi:hypothetical protein